MKITNIMAVSLDGRIAASPLQNDVGRMNLGFGCKADHDFVRQQIRGADAIITGANSVRAAKGVWDEVGKSGVYPLWIIFTVNGLEADLAVWRQIKIPKLIVSPRPLPPAAAANPNCEFLCYGNSAPARFVCDVLAGRGKHDVLLFGGGHINRLFYAENLVNELKVTLSPVIIGRNDAPYFVNPGLDAPKQLELLSSHTAENHIFLSYRVRKSATA